jgi:hypothetical protein
MYHLFQGIQMTDKAFPDTWVPSRFNTSVDLPGGKKAVFNTRTLALAILETRDWERCLAPGLRHRLRAARDAAPLAAFHARGLLVSDGIDPTASTRSTSCASSSPPAATAATWRGSA